MLFDDIRTINATDLSNLSSVECELNVELRSESAWTLRHTLDWLFSDPESVLQENNQLIIASILIHLNDDRVNPNCDLSKLYKLTKSKKIALLKILNLCAHSGNGYERPSWWIEDSLTVFSELEERYKTKEIK